MVWLGVLLTLASIVLWVYAFFDALTTPAQEVRNLPKMLWLIVVLLLMHVGALLWLFFGRPRAASVDAAAANRAPSAGTTHTPGPLQPPKRDRPIGPDDDPDFLRDINRRINPDD